MVARKKHNYSKDLQFLFFISSTILIILLSILNLEKSHKKVSNVLGAQTIDNNEEFWKGFLEKNPEYIDGWLELGEIEKVKKIDPNYFKN